MPHPPASAVDAVCRRPVACDCMLPQRSQRHIRTHVYAVSQFQNTPQRTENTPNRVKPAWKTQLSTNGAAMSLGARAQHSASHHRCPDVPERICCHLHAASPHQLQQSRFDRCEHISGELYFRIIAGSQCTLSLTSVDINANAMRTTQRAKHHASMVLP